jgi:hypothetical protein
MRLSHAALVITAGIILAPPAPAQGSGKFVPTASMSVPRVGHSATLLLNEQVLIAGGAGTSASGDAWDTAELYDIEVGEFIPAGRMTTPRFGHTATLLPDGKVLIAGGSPTTNYRPGTMVLASCEIYDPWTNTFTPASPLTVTRMAHTATLLNNGRILIAGGLGTWAGSGSNSGIDTRWAGAELYDAVTHTSVPTGNMTTERFDHTAELLPDGRVLVGGGAGREDGPLIDLEVYDPASGTFRVGARAACLTAHPGCGYYSSASVGPRITGLLPNGSVLASMNHYDGPTTEARIYDPVTNTFGSAATMRAPRNVTAALLSSGLVLVTGYALGSGSPGADLYDPASGAFLPAGEMLAPREGHTATWMTNLGGVLIAGGTQRTSAALASAELYLPPDPTFSPVGVLLAPQALGGIPAVLHAGTARIVSARDPAVRGEALELYATGLVQGSPVPPQVSVGGRLAEVLFFGEAPGYPGVSQINIRVPSDVEQRPDARVWFKYLGRLSWPITIPVN